MSEDERTIEGWDELRAAGAVAPVSTAVLARSEVAVRAAAWQRPRRRTRLVLVPGIAAAAVAVMILVPAGQQAQQPPAEPDTTGSSPRPSGPLTGAEVTSCAERYGPETLRKRTFAFDGTVVAIADAPGGTPPWLGRVTFAVHRWLRGGNGNRVTIQMMPPTRGPDDAGGEFGAAYRVGSRLLVSGEPVGGDRFAWFCGFSRWYDPATAKVWQDVFSR